MNGIRTSGHQGSRTRCSLRVRALELIVAVLSALSGGGCDRLDMYDQPRYEPLESSSFFSDGLSARQPVEGTVARGRLPEDEAFSTGKEAGRPVARLPEPALRAVFERDPGRFGNRYDDVDPSELRHALLERGQERFDIYCSPCHGWTGDGDGMIVGRGFRKPPSYHLDRLRGAASGHYFDVISNGFGAMAPYASRIVPADRWAIVAYIRALQLARQAPIDDLSAAQRAALPPVSGQDGPEGSP